MEQDGLDAHVVWSMRAHTRRHYYEMEIAVRVRPNESTFIYRSQRAYVLLPVPNSIFVNQDPAGLGVMDTIRCFPSGPRYSGRIQRNTLCSIEFSLR